MKILDYEDWITLALHLRKLREMFFEDKLIYKLPKGTTHNFTKSLQFLDRFFSDAEERFFQEHPEMATTKVFYGAIRPDDEHLWEFLNADFQTSTSFAALKVKVESRKLKNIIDKLSDEHGRFSLIQVLERVEKEMPDLEVPEVINFIEFQKREGKLYEPETEKYSKAR